MTINENSRLLKVATPDCVSSDLNYLPVDASSFSFSSELTHLAITSAPVAFSYALQNSLQTFSVVIAGSLNSHALSVAAFSYMIAMCTTWCVALGGGTAFDTFASSLYSSAHAKIEVGVCLQRCLVILYVISSLSLCNHDQIMNCVYL